MIGFFVILLRLQIAVISTPLVIIFLLLVLPFETGIVLVSFPIAVVIMRREELKASWLGTYPNSLGVMHNALENIWHWVFYD